MRGIRYAMRASGAARTLIGIEDNKPDAISALQAALPQDGSVAVKVMQTKYPQGAEEMIIFSLLGREVPAGSRPASVGVLLSNVMTLAYLGRLLPAGEGMIERVITVAGPGVKKPGNYVVPLGTPLRFLLEYAGIHSGAHEIILGGPMMGPAIASLDIAITKGTSGVLAFGDSQLAAETRRSYACIKCGECLSVCPKHLNPSQLGMLAAKREYALMAANYHLDRCFECGCCSYVCPSHIPLVQQFRIAKAINREKATA
jgi:electron transport complex protein RnfC